MTLPQSDTPRTNELIRRIDLRPTGRGFHNPNYKYELSKFARTLELELQSLRAGREEILEECARVCFNEAIRLQEESNAAFNRGAGVTANLMAGKRDTADRLKNSIRALKQPLPEREG